MITRAMALRPLVIVGYVFAIAFVALVVNTNTLGWRQLWRDPIVRVAIAASVIGLLCIGAS